MSSLLPEGGRYDFEMTQKLVDAFSAMEGLKPDYLMPYAGSSEPLHYTTLAFTSKERSLVVADPSYEAPLYAAKFSGANIVKVPLAKDYSHDVRAMIAADPNAGVFYICNPNNPTGTITSREDIEYALANKPKGSILLVDEAYIHFSDATPSIDLVKADKDLIVLRTFSKIYGMAGLRCGFAIGRPDLLAKIQAYGMNIDADPRGGGGDEQPAGSGTGAGAAQDQHRYPERKRLPGWRRTTTSSFRRRPTASWSTRDGRAKK